MASWIVEPCGHQTARRRRTPFSLRPKRLPSRSLARLWQEILRVDRVGGNDNFFESGGHSLLAMQLVRRIHDRFGIELPLQNLFQRPRFERFRCGIDSLSTAAAAQAGNRHR